MSKKGQERASRRCCRAGSVICMAECGRRLAARETVEGWAQGGQALSWVKWGKFYEESERKASYSRPHMELGER